MGDRQETGKHKIINLFRENDLENNLEKKLTNIYKKHTK